jgi:hypothetical protein
VPPAALVPGLPLPTVPLPPALPVPVPDREARSWWGAELLDWLGRAV